MVEQAVVIAAGTDRPGIMDELSQFLLESGGNVTDIRSINLHGLYALMLLVRADAPAMESIRRGLPALAGAGIHAELRPVDAVTQPEAPNFPYVFIATGKDQAGVLYRLSHLLRVLKVNIDDIETHVAADLSFQIRLNLSVPRETPITMLRDYLTYLCNELNITGELKEA